MTQKISENGSPGLVEEISMDWKTVAGKTPTDIHYEVSPEDGIQLRIEAVRQNDWPVFRWIVHFDVGGQVFHHEETSVDLAAAKHLAEKFMRLGLSALKQK